MNILKKILKMISYEENLKNENFILKETEDDKPQNNNTEIKTELASGKPEANSAKKNENDQQSSSERKFKKPLRASDFKKVQERENSTEPVNAEDTISTFLEVNREKIKELYGFPENKDIVIREFVLGSSPPVKGFAVFMEGLTDKNLQDMLFQALMLFSNAVPPWDTGKIARTVTERLLPGNQVSVHSTFREVLDAVNYGETAIFIEGSTNSLSVETKGWDRRGIERPVNEQLIRGPQEAFNETLRSNTALIRKAIKNENLTTEIFKLGTRNKTDVAIMYLRNLANPSLVAEVKRRIKSIKVDYLKDAGILEQFIEDEPYNLFPQIVATERPDRVSSMIVEGRVAILVDGSPFALVVPTSLYSLLHTGEETYLRWQYGTFLRYVRVLAFYVSFLLPGTYLAIVLFHHEMLPTELLLAIAGNRERVPFPSVVEVLLMELSFELIREAGLRLPGIMGSTIGIVGALILGQAAVQANIVSPILVILVAVTGLASFAIPNHSLSFALRIYRFFFIALGATLGFFGITLGIAVQIFLTTNIKSFGVPFMAPTGPRTRAGVDVTARLPIFFHEKRPDYLNPQDITRQPKVSRGWVKGKGDGNNDQSG